MGRTNIEIDDALVRRVMLENDLPTKRAAVDFALRKVVKRVPMSIEDMRSCRGMGWDGDLDEMRNEPPIEQW